MEVKVILTVMKQLKQLQRKPRKNSEAQTGFEPMTTSILYLLCIYIHIYIMYTSGNLSLRSELVEVSILPTQLVDFLYDMLGEFRLNGMNVDIE